MGYITHGSLSSLVCYIGLRILISTFQGAHGAKASECMQSTWPGAWHIEITHEHCFWLCFHCYCYISGAFHGLSALPISWYSVKLIVFHRKHHEFKTLPSQFPLHKIGERVRVSERGRGTHSLLCPRSALLGRLSSQVQKTDLSNHPCLSCPFSASKALHQALAPGGQTPLLRTEKLGIRVDSAPGQSCLGAEGGLPLST